MVRLHARLHACLHARLHAHLHARLHARLPAPTPAVLKEDMHIPSFKPKAVAVESKPKPKGKPTSDPSRERHAGGRSSTEMHEDMRKGWSDSGSDSEGEVNLVLADVDTPNHSSTSLLDLPPRPPSSTSLLNLPPQPPSSTSLLDLPPQPHSSTSLPRSRRSACRARTPCRPRKTMPRTWRRSRPCWVDGGGRWKRGREGGEGGL